MFSSPQSFLPLQSCLFFTGRFSYTVVKGTLPLCLMASVLYGVEEVPLLRALHGQNVVEDLAKL